MRRSTCTRLEAVAAACLIFAAAVDTAQAAERPLLQIEAASHRHEGTPLLADSQLLWLLERDGQAVRLRTPDITSYEVLPGGFQPLPSADVRDRLLRAFGSDFQVTSTLHYLVCHPKGAFGSQYADLFEGHYRLLAQYLSVRGITFDEPEFPLCAVVFPDRAAFLSFATREGMKAGPGLVGLYSQYTNRIMLYDQVAQQALDWGNLAGDNAVFHNVSTILHEATHQVAFNTGLHRRLADTPQWVIEGLGTYFEVPSAARSRDASALVNRMRLADFREFLKWRHKPGSLESLLTDDRRFQGTWVLDAYGQAWALTYFLIQTRPQQYADYLKQLAAREPFVRYKPSDRLADFTTAFGTDLPMLEAHLLRYMQALPANQ